MSDQSHLDGKYFIDRHVYNCPFCNRNNVKYVLEGRNSFDWSKTKKCHVYYVKCSSCYHRSMHMSYVELATKAYDMFDVGPDLDSSIFYSVPTSFFVLDDRIPKVIRDLITEGEGCLKMNFLTGASACMRKAIYELLVLEKAEGGTYEDKIKSLKNKHAQTDPELFEVLGHIQNMTSDKVHEQSWPAWNSTNLRLISETLREVLREIYILPAEKKLRAEKIKKLREDATTGKVDPQPASKPKP